MKAIVCERSDSEGYAVYRDFPEPVAGPGEITVDTRAMSVNFPDPLQLKGLYQIQPECPFVMGMEFSGVVKTVGESVSRFKPGDRVIGMAIGAFAEAVLAEEHVCYPIPESISFEQGALLPLAAGTAMYGLHTRAQLKKGETLLVFGASGGTGSAAVQIGKALGAKVIATCSSPEKAALAKQAGADHIIDYTTENLRESLKELTEGKGLDVVYDTVGGALFEPANRAMAWNGRYLVVGFASGEIPKLPVNLALLKGYSLIGVNWSSMHRYHDAEARPIVAELVKLYEKGLYKPIIDSVMTLSKGVEAIEKMRDRDIKGKILLTID